MPSCATCSADLKPPVCARRIAYVKTPYRISGQGYCRRHAINAGAGVITEKPRSWPDYPPSTWTAGSQATGQSD